MGERVYDTPLLDKLGAKPGMRALLVGAFDDPFVRELRGRVADVSLGGRGSGFDLAFLRVKAPKDLEGLASLEKRIARNGAIWLVLPRGRPALKDTVLIAAGKAAGLVDNKVCRFSDTHTALRFVVPLARRERAAAKR